MRASVLLACSLFATCLLLLPSVRAGSASARGGLCRPLSSDFAFARQPPAPASDLAFCKEYRQHTCCNKAASMAVLRSLTPYFDTTSERVAGSFSESCRQLASLISCSPCHPDVGTGARVGICPSLCDEWYSACESGLFTSVDGLLRPCTEASLVCAPLREIVSSGADMCRRTGYGLGHVTEAVTGGVRDEVERLLKDAESQSEEDDEQTPPPVSCFDGSVSDASGRVTYSSSDAAAAADAAADDASGGRRTRYYKTAEEVAEMERTRAAREQAAQMREFTHQPLVKMATRMVSAISSAVQPLRREFGRALRRIPYLPRSWVRTLESSHVAFCLLLLALQLSVWSVILRPLFSYLSRRMCRGRQRRGDNTTPVWTAESHPTRRFGLTGALAASAASKSASGLTADQVRQQRAEKLMEQQYRKAQETHSDDDEADDGEHTRRAAAVKSNVTIIDGEVVSLDE